MNTFLKDQTVTNNKSKFDPMKGSRSATEIDIAVGKKIRELRTDSAITLSELGEALGISHQQLQKYETGTNRLSAGMLYKVAAVLNVPIQTLFDEVETQSPARKQRLPIGLRNTLENAKRAIDSTLDTFE